jgi:DNA (cytosine-5)-methyltransferase 1
MALLRLRRRIRIRESGDADPVLEKALQTELGRPVRADLKGLVASGFVREVNGRFDLTHTFNGKYRRLKWEGPSYTVDTRFGDPRYFLHPEQQRGFTVRETARIQGFPDSYVLSGAERDQFRLLGNAVPPPLARALAESILSGLLP